MIFPAWKKHELLISGILSVLFFIISTVGTYVYIATLDELTHNPHQTYAQQSEIQGVSAVVTQQPISTLSAQPSRTITTTPSATPSQASNPHITVEPTPLELSTPTTTPLPTIEQTDTQKILSALNTYRQKSGKEPLAIDTTLQSFAQSRAEAFDAIGDMDNHAGFQSMLNDNGFEKMGFNALGENSSFGEWGTAQNLIESIYASSPAHNESQLRSDWTHVGIGVKGSATNIVFGGKKR